MLDELTSRMHAEFTASTETDIMHKAWSAISAILELDYTALQVCELYVISIADIDNARESYQQVTKPFNGMHLFKYYTAKRDYSGSSEDEYAQLLCTLFAHIKENLFDLLTEAEKTHKKLAVQDEMKDEYSAHDVIFI